MVDMIYPGVTVQDYIVQVRRTTC
uniref:Uncharacterized protein n=1 Tax=Anguilla anguilla TaxID=7936 RepID=A0A0E9Q4S9_ANGAN